MAQQESDPERLGVMVHAYLSGQRVNRSNAPAAPVPPASATARRPARAMSAPPEGVTAPRGQGRIARRTITIDGLRGASPSVNQITTRQEALYSSGVVAEHIVRRYVEGIQSERETGSYVQDALQESETRTMMSRTTAGRKIIAMEEREPASQRLGVMVHTYLSGTWDGEGDLPPQDTTR